MQWSADHCGPLAGFELMLLSLLGEPLPPLPPLPGRHCHGLHDEHRGHDWLAESWDAGQAVRPGWRT